MYTLNFFIGISLAEDNEVVGAVKRTIFLPIVPYNGLLIETENMTLEVNLLGYSLKDQAFFSIIDDDSIDSIEDLDTTYSSWFNSGFQQCEIADLLAKTRFL